MLAVKSSFSYCIALFLLLSWTESRAQATITGYSATKGPAGAQIEVYGTNFTVEISATAIQFNGVSAQMVGAQANQLSVIVPAGATTGPITYTKSGNVATGPVFEVACLGPGMTTSGDVEACDGSTITLIAGGASTYQWTTPSGVVSSGNTLNVTLNQPLPHNGWTVVGTHTSGCANLVTIHINTQDCGPVITSFSPLNGLPGTSVTINGTDFNPSLTGNVVKFNGITATVTSTTSTMITATVPAGATTGPITVDDGSQTGTSTNHFKVCATPTVTVTPDQSMCPGAPTQLEAAGAQSYAWSPSNYLSSTTGSTVTASPISSRVYTVTGTTTEGCSAQASVSLTVVNCLALYSFQPTNGAPGTSVTISGAAFGSDASAITLKFNGIVAQFTLIDDLTLVAVVPPNATSGAITISIGTSIAISQSNFTVGEAMGITSFSPTKGGFGTIVTISGWGFSTNFSQNVVRFNGVLAHVTAATPTTITAVVEGTITSGPISVTTGAVSITSSETFTACTPPTLITSLMNSSICQGGGLVQIDASGALSYSWTPAAGLSSTTESSVLAGPSVTTTYTVVGTDASGCSTARTSRVTVGDCNLKITSFTPQSGPIGTTITITGTGFHAIPSQNRVTFNEGLGGVVSGTTTSLQVVVGSFATSGPLAVRHSGFGGEFTAMGNTNFIVTSAVPCQPQSLTISPEATICPGQSATLTVSGASTYSWSPSTGLSSTTGNEVIANPTQTTTYTVTGTHSPGCTSTSTVKVNVGTCIQSRLGRFSVDKTSGCVPLTVNIVNANLVTTGECTGAKPCMMSLSGGLQQQQNTFSFTINTPGTYNLSVLYQAIGVDDITITANPSPDVAVSSTIGQVTAANTITICPLNGSQMSLTASGATSYSWQHNNSSAETVTINPGVTTTYYVTGTTGSCSRTAATTVSVLPSCQPLTISLFKMTVPQGSDFAPVGATISSEFKPVDISFVHRRIISSQWTTEPPVNTSQSLHTLVVPAEWLDEFGMEYYFTVTDRYQRVATTAKDFIYWDRIKSAPTVPLATGQAAEDYRIVSVPAQTQQLTNVFQNALEAFGGFDDAKWRVVQYRDGLNVDHTTGLTTIEPGNGYWFLSVSPTTLNITGRQVEVNQENPFVMTLDQGWTQIGNPFTWDISWPDVLAKNGNPPGIGELYVFDAGFKVSSNLKAWGGGFVNSTQARTINIPVNVHNGTGKTSGGRDHAGLDIDETSWFVPVTLSQGSVVNDLGGFGMSPGASPGRDQFDESTLPRFIKYLELNSPHPEYFQPSFMRDVVPPAEGHTWTFTVESNREEPYAHISWDHLSLAQNQSSLFLHDPGARRIVDMKKQGTYSFELKGKRTLKMLFGRNESQVRVESSGLGIPFPNPVSESTTIPFLTANDGAAQLAIYDMLGRKVRDLGGISLRSGYHEVMWDATDSNGVRVSSGLYIVRLVDGYSNSHEVRILIK